MYNILFGPHVDTTHSQTGFSSEHSQAGSAQARRKLWLSGLLKMRKHFNFFLKLADNTLRMISALFTEVWKMRHLINLIVCEKQCKWWGIDCLLLTHCLGTWNYTVVRQVCPASTQMTDRMEAFIYCKLLWLLTNTNGNSAAVPWKNWKQITISSVQ